MRNAGLDLLRLVAVFLVLGRHMSLCPRGDGAVLRQITAVWRTGGWIGVDLFFVLSGYLVSGLLFREYQASGRMDFTRFLVRRGFKIYPSFWLLLGVSSLVAHANGSALPPRRLFAELAFLQNYLGGVWNHTWSLAVEEHFYFGLAGLFYWFMVARRRTSFDWIPSAFIVIASTCLLLRLVMWHVVPIYVDTVHLFPTHVRIDSLFFGVLLAWAQHFDRDFLRFANWSTRTLLVLGVLLLSPAFVLPVDEFWFISAFGVIGFYCGAGCLVLAAARLRRVQGRFARGCAALGAASYSLYLWHMPVKVFGGRLLAQTTGLTAWWPQTACYFIGTCVVGYYSALLVETPFLLLRDRLYPSSRAPVLEGAGAARE
ncbi:MAG TPA: acyltransferase [Polyangiales bacterium]|nr:acyltransferase [Polyangiales bacterium]